MESPRLGHLLGVNGFFTALAGHARHHPDHVLGPDGVGGLTSWVSERRFADTFFLTNAAGVHPDGYGCWEAHGRAVRFFLEYDTGTESHPTLTSKLAAYTDFGAGEHGILLFSVHSARRESHLHHALTRALPGHGSPRRPALAGGRDGAGLVIATTSRDRRPPRRPGRAGVGAVGPSTGHTTATAAAGRPPPTRTRPGPSPAGRGPAVQLRRLRPRPARPRPCRPRRHRRPTRRQLGQRRQRRLLGEPVTDIHPTEPKQKETGTDRLPGAHHQPGGRRQPGTYIGQRCVRRAVPDPDPAETVTPAGSAPAGSAPVRGRSGRPATPRGGRGPRPAPSPAHPARTPRPIRPVRPARPDGWHVERVDTAPMTAEEYTAAVNALAVLITTWTQQVHDSDDPAEKAT